jgi:N-acetyl-anhydromuramyl-L-alanine amidase AmpD
MTKLGYLVLITGFILFQNSICWSQEGITIVDKKIDFGYRPSPKRNIKQIIVHSVFNNIGGEKYNIELIIKQFSIYKVSAHYIIDRQGIIYNLVDENNIAFHAGKSRLPNGQSNINSSSIGIELLTAYDESPTKQQIEALIKLVLDIKKRHSIDFILRHSDIAPGRKTDPWNMDWNTFISQVSH